MGEVDFLSHPKSLTTLVDKKTFRQLRNNIRFKDNFLQQFWCSFGFLLAVTLSLIMFYNVWPK